MSVPLVSICLPSLNTRPFLEERMETILAQTLSDTQGQIVISGHTDNVPIDNFQFRSNWELSAARAATVAHVFLRHDVVPRVRIHLEAYADTQPIDTNETMEGRAKNRRVEIAVVYAEDAAYEREGSEAEAKSSESAVGGMTQ